MAFHPPFVPQRDPSAPPPDPAMPRAESRGFRMSEEQSLLAQRLCFKRATVHASFSLEYNC